MKNTEEEKNKQMKNNNTELWTINDISMRQ